MTVLLVALRAGLMTPSTVLRVLTVLMFPIAPTTLTTGPISLTLPATTPFTPAVRLRAAKRLQVTVTQFAVCLLYTSDAADE